MDPILPEPIQQNSSAQTYSQLPQSNDNGLARDSDGSQAAADPTSPPYVPAAQTIQQIQPVQNQQQVVSQPEPAIANNGNNVQAPQTIQQIQPVQNQQQSVPVLSQTGTPLIADDIDVIEKEWVDKAKQIVNQTKQDPHLQEKEISKLQADYLEKRYNKKIKRTD